MFVIKLSIYYNINKSLRVKFGAARFSVDYVKNDK